VVSRTSLKNWAGLSALILLLASPASAQLGIQLSSYTGRNAPGYLKPLVDALGADLNAGLYHSARIPERGLQIGLEITYMSARFSDADKKFIAVTENGFEPEQSAEASTVVGPTEAVYVDGESGTRFAFPGGFDLGSFDFAVPQLRVGSLYGTEALIRFGFMYSGDADLGNFHLYGVGFRHSVSQYFNGLPIDVAVGATWQRFSLGDNERGGHLVSAQAWTVGFQTSKRFSWLEPYAGVAYDDFGLDLSYNGGTAEDTIEMSLDSKDHFRATIGLSANVSFAVVQGEYNIGGQDAFAFALAVRYQPLR
jgi:hypothetical protein